MTHRRTYFPSSPRRGGAKRRGGGFTLLEILIALAIVAIGLAAAVRATAQVIAGTEHTRMRLLATWVAQDRLAEHSARAAWPAPGTATGNATQGPFQFAWHETVIPTPEPALRQIDIVVAAAGQPHYVLARLTGFLAGPEKRP
jgi:general secretion pathway protein I